jgi:hypothetical protein
VISFADVSTVDSKFPPGVAARIPTGISGRGGAKMHNWKKVDPLQVLGWSVVAGAIYLWMPGMPGDNKAYVQADHPGSDGIHLVNERGTTNLTSTSERAKPSS